MHRACHTNDPRASLFCRASGVPATLENAWTNYRQISFASLKQTLAELKMRLRIKEKDLKIHLLESHA